MSSSLSPLYRILTPEEIAALEEDAATTRDEYEQMWRHFFTGYMGMGISSLPTAYLRDLYPWFGDPTAVVKKIRVAVPLGADLFTWRPDERTRHFLNRINRLVDATTTDLRFASIRMDLPNLYMYTQQANMITEHARAWRRMQAFINFLHHLQMRIDMPSGNRRPEEIAPLHDVNYQQLFKQMGDYLRAAGV